MKTTKGYVPACMMQKLLAVVLGFSIIWSSVTPALGQAAAAGRSMRTLPRVGRNINRVSTAHLTNTVGRQVAFRTAFTNSLIQQRVLAGNVVGHADFILQSSSARLMHHDFVALNFVPGAVSPVQRTEALSFYKHNLQTNPQALHTSYTNLTQFLHTAKTNPGDVSVQAVENTLADAAAMALLGTREQAPVLMDFYTHAQGTIFEDTAAIITARGLLRMQAYDELGRLLSQHANQAVLSGVTSYIQEEHLPVEIPAGFPEKTAALPVNAELSGFLQNSFPLGDLSADSSLEATRFWMSLQQPKPAATSSHTPAKPTTSSRVRTDAAAVQEPEPSAVAEEAALPHTAQVQPETTQPAANQPVADIPAETLGDSTPRWIEVETTNALGNTVKTWQPNPAHPDFAQLMAEQAGTAAAGKQPGWLERARLNWALNWKPTFQNMFNFGTSRYGVAGVGAGAAPLTSEAAIAQAAEVPAVVQTVRAQQGMFISDEALRGGSGASYQTGAANPGGIAAQQYALQNTGATAAEQTLAGAGYLTPSTLSSVRPWLKAAALIPAGVAGASLLFGSDLGITEGLQPTLAMAPMLATLQGYFQSEVQRANRIAEGTLSQQYPLTTALVQILQGQASIKNKKAALLKLYNRGKLTGVLNSLKRSNPETYTQLMKYEQEGNWEQFAVALYDLYRLGVVAPVINKLTDSEIQSALLTDLNFLIQDADFQQQAIRLYHNEKVVPSSRQTFQGDVPIVPEADQEKIAKTFRTEAEITIQVGQDNGTYIHYEGDIPFYYRRSDGTVSSQPVGILSQKKSGWYNTLLSYIPFGVKKDNNTGKRHIQWAADRQGIDIPKGFVLALDEQGQWKFVMPRGNRAMVESVPNSYRLLQTIQTQGSARVEMDTPYTSTDLLAMAHMLEHHPTLRLQLVLNPPSSLKPWLTMFGGYIGLDAAASLTGPYKEGVKTIESIPTGALSNGVSGAGYLSPWIGGVAMKWMTKLGYVPSILGLSAISFTGLIYAYKKLGLDGRALEELQQMDTGELLTALSMPMALLVITASLFGALVPVLLNIFKDPTTRTSANLQFSTTKQYSRLFLTLASFGLAYKPIMNFVGITPLDWTIVVPIALGLLTASTGLFLNTPMFKQWKNQLRAKEDDQQAEPKREATKEEKKAFAQEYNNVFVKTPGVRAMKSRVRGVYWAYAASLMMIGQLSSALLKDPVSGVNYGQLLIAGFMFATAQMRSIATRQVQNRVRTDDQFTGMSLPLLAGTSIALALLPYSLTWAGIATAAVAMLHYVGTAVPGQLDSTRIQNMVSAQMQQQKQAVLDTPGLSEAEKKEQLAVLELKEKDWASRASATYSYANGFGLWGVGGAAALAGMFMDWGPDFLLNFLDNVASITGHAGESHGFTMSRLVFAISSILLLRLTKKNWSMTKDFWGSWFKQTVSQENIAAGKITPATFGITEKNASDQLSGVSKELNKMKDKFAVYGVVSETKMTDLYNAMAKLHNQLVAISKVLGMTPEVKQEFEKLMKYSRSFRVIIQNNGLSEMLQREFDRMAQMMSVDGALQQVSEQPQFVEQGLYKMPQAYQKYEDAKQLINEMDLMAHHFVSGQSVSADMYTLFIEYYNRVWEELQEYRRANVADSKRTGLLLNRLNNICLQLKHADDEHKVLQINKGPTSEQDVQALRDMLNGIATGNNPQQYVSGTPLGKLDSPLPAY